MPETFIKVLKNGLLPILLGCGLFFVNIRPYHDWGDDFAQYFQEAQNLAEGKSLYYSPHVYNPDFYRLGPEVYPPGFPAFLTISNTLFVDQIIGAQYLITVFLILMGWVSFLLFQRYNIPWLVSLLLMLTLIYHPWMLQQKSEVLSDIPFSFFMLLTILLAQDKKSLGWFALSGLAAGIAISIRSAGWILPVAGITAMAYSFWKNKPAVKSYLAFTLCSSGSGILLNLILGYYSGSAGYASHFTDSFKKLGTIIQTNINGYTETINRFIEVEVNEWHFVLLVIQVFFWVSLFRGMLKWNKHLFPTLVFISYLTLLLIFQFNGGFRFLLPLIPLLFILAFQGGQNLIKQSGIYWSIALIVLNIYYQPHRKYTVTQQELPQAGPQLKESQEIFEFIKNNLGDDDLVIFSKPRALAYYTQKPATATLWELNQQEFRTYVEKVDANYFLHYKDIPYSALNEFVEKQKDRLTPVFSNEKFVLYKLAD